MSHTRGLAEHIRGAGFDIFGCLGSKCRSGMCLPLAVHTMCVSDISY